MGARVESNGGMNHTKQRCPKKARIKMTSRSSRVAIAIQTKVQSEGGCFAIACKHTQGLYERSPGLRTESHRLRAGGGLFELRNFILLWNTEAVAVLQTKFGIKERREEKQMTNDPRHHF